MIGANDGLKLTLKKNLKYYRKSKENENRFGWNKNKKGN